MAYCTCWMTIDEWQTIKEPIKFADLQMKLTFPLMTAWYASCSPSNTTACQKSNRDLKQRQQNINEEKQSCVLNFGTFWYFLSSAKQREVTKFKVLWRTWGKTIVRLKFWYISVLSSKFKVLWRTWTHDGEFFTFFFNSNTTPTNLVPR